MHSKCTAFRAHFHFLYYLVHVLIIDVYYYIFGALLMTVTERMDVTIIHSRQIKRETRHVLSVRAVKTLAKLAYMLNVQCKLI